MTSIKWPQFEITYADGEQVTMTAPCQEVAEQWASEERPRVKVTGIREKG